MKLLAIALALGACVEAQTLPPRDAISLDFENDLRGWTKSGSAFDQQPVQASNVGNPRLPLRVGGDYRRDVSYRVGQHGSFLIATGHSALPGTSDDSRTGTLTSEDFVLQRGEPYFSFLIGGSADIEHERLELQICFDAVADLHELERQWMDWSHEGAVRRDGKYLVAIRATGSNRDELHQVVFQLPGFLMGRTARLKIIDDSVTGHINADYLRFTTVPPESRPEPVWGFADYHTHPMSYLAFGGIQQPPIHTLWGSPGGAIEEYGDPNRIGQDIRRCVSRHDGGPLAEVFINTSERRTRLGNLGQIFWQWISFKLLWHGRSGFPDYKNFPSFLSGAHEQMHVTQIHRAYEGGLRLMVALAVNNKGAEYSVSRVQNNHIELSNERAVVEAQICGMIRLANLNPGWMEIAYSPEQAREIIAQDRLAVILGVEVDQLAELGFDSVESEAGYLWNLGIRQVIPVHAVDNRIGSPSVLFEIYNSLNDFLNRGRLDVPTKDLGTVPERFFQVEEAGCNGPLYEQRGECDVSHGRQTIPSIDPLFAAVRGFSVSRDCCSA